MTDEETEAAKKLVENSFNRKLYIKDGLGYLKFLSSSFFTQETFWTNGGQTSADKRQASINAGEYIRDVLIPIHKQTIENADTTAD